LVSKVIFYLIKRVIYLR